MSHQTSANHPKRNTGHPAKDSGGGMIDDDWGDLREALAWSIRRWNWEMGFDKAMPIPPDDYARHWTLEGPRRPD